MLILDNREWLSGTGASFVSRPVDQLAEFAAAQLAAVRAALQLDWGRSRPMPLWRGAWCHLQLRLSQRRRQARSGVCDSLRFFQRGLERPAQIGANASSSPSLLPVGLDLQDVSVADVAQRPAFGR